MPGYDEFVDPNSAIARIIAQMQGAATRSNPDAISQETIQGDLQPGGAQPGPVGTGPGMQSEMGPEDLESLAYMRGRDPQDLIRSLLDRSGGESLSRKRR